MRPVMKKNIIIILLLFFIVSVSKADLIIYFDMEDTGNPLIDQVAGKTASEVGTGHHYSIDSPVGKSVRLTENGSWQLSVSDSAQLNALANNFSVAAWVYFDSSISKSGTSSKNRRIIGDDEAWDRDAWSFGIRDGRLLFTKNGIIDAHSNITVPQNQWVHVAAVVSSTKGIEFYLDGILSHTIGNTANNHLGNDIFGIGRSYAAGQEQWFAGNMDEIRVYNTVLDEAQIADLAFSDVTFPVRVIRPVDESMNVSIASEPTLQWLSGTDENIVEHVLYFSTDLDWATNALPTDPGTIILDVATETYQHDEALAYETTYYWRVDEATGNLNNPTKVETGPVWSFTTRSEPVPPCSSYRFDGDIDGDCFVGMKDLMLLAADWMLNSQESLADIDENTRVDYADFAYVGRDWLEFVNTQKIMFVSTHPDDEGIFFGGAIAYYAQVLKVPTVHISMTSGDWNRVHEIRETELTNADSIYFGREVTASIGLPPDTSADLFFPRFKDAPTPSVDATFDWWNDGVPDNGDAAQGREKAINTIATYIRILKPEVIATHDLDGEYGHNNHRAAAWTVVEAYDRAADEDYVDGNEPWLAKKLYVHQSQANGLGTNGYSFVGWLFHDFWEDYSIDTDGDEIADMTPRQVADLGLDEHISQGRPDVSTVYRTDDNFNGHHCEWWGLLRSTVGPDTVSEDFTIMGTNYSGWSIGNFMENLGKEN